MAVKYKRVLLKLSGEMLAGPQQTGLDTDTLRSICSSIKEASDLGAQIAVVVGGGNFWRGRSSGEMNRSRADHMGMLATVINALALVDMLEQLGAEVRVQTAVAMQEIAEPYSRGRAIRHLEKGRILILGCGTGCPYFSTDTASSLRAADIDADIIMKATKVDGVYDSDPKINVNAIKYEILSFAEVLRKQLGVMDATAASLCAENNIPIMVFNLDDPHNIVRAIEGEQIGTIVRAEESK